MEIHDKERFYRLRFYAFLGCGAVVSIIYIITLGVAFNLAQRRTSAMMNAVSAKWHSSLEERRSEHERIIVQIKAMADCSFRSHREIIRKLDHLETELTSDGVHP